MNATLPLFSQPTVRLGRAGGVLLLAVMLSACGTFTKTDSAAAPSSRNLLTQSNNNASPRPPASSGDTAADGLKLARLLRDQGRYEGAAGVYAQLEQRGSLKPLELLEYASVAAPTQSPRDNLALFGRARRALNEAGVKATPAATVTLCNGLGRARMALGQRDAALNDFDCTLAADANNVAALNAKGVLLDAGGDHEQARKLLSQAWELDPSDFRVLNNLALSHLASGDAQQAIRLLSQADGTQLPTLKLNLAFAQTLQGDESGARKTLEGIMAPTLVPQALADFAQRRERIRAGAPVADELMAASRQALRLREKETNGNG
ncbi:tetratricopeptide repeat protein [Achromobacter spanius]|uniref:tetratricopeptide repeat protein n=1 Tax=Achromobacter spanius TaxID=217203 RepID=UPI003209974A